MAGIGFELKKLFAKKGLLSLFKAYGYAGIVCTGPMILGMLLLLGVRMLAEYGGLDTHSIELLNCMITYTLLVSLVVSSLFSMVTTRYLADMMYENKNELVMPCFHGSTSIMLIVGGAAYGVFLWNAGISVQDRILCLMLFMELVVVWTQISFLTAIKDYRGVLLTFIVSLSVGLAFSFVLIKIGVPVLTALMIAVITSYGIMLVWYYVLLLKYFPQGRGSAFRFLRWVSNYPSLLFLGLFLVLGMSFHIVVMWYSPIGIQVQGLFYSASVYDIPAELAFLSIMITTINYVTSVEVHFYPKYHNYFSLYNDGGALVDILQAEKAMKETLIKELSYAFVKQLFCTMIFIFLGTAIIPELPLYFTDEMLGIYRILCIGYALYALGNCAVLSLLYFSDNRGAFWSGFFFALISIAGTFLIREKSIIYYGYGFLAGGLLFTLTSFIRLLIYMRKLSYHILCAQPIVYRERRTILIRLCEYLERSYARKYEREIEKEDRRYNSKSEKNRTLDNKNKVLISD